MPNSFSSPFSSVGSGVWTLREAQAFPDVKDPGLALIENDGSRMAARMMMRVHIKYTWYETESYREVW